MFRFRFSAALVIVSLPVACSEGSADEATGGTAAMAGDAGATGDEPLAGSPPSTGGSPPVVSPGGGAGAEPTAALAGQGGDVPAGDGGSSSEAGDGPGGEPSAGAGGQPPKTVYVNGCFAFVDRTAEAASRTIVWDDALIFDPARCLRVRVGQTVLFAGNHENHPMAPKGGDVPNPVGPTAIFSQPGIFGYECIPHPSEMNGAIEVIP